jgi:ferredoxin
MSLLSFAERLAAVDRSGVALETGRCLHAQDKASTCAACFEICPAQAITAGAPPTLDPKKCQGCLACLPVCPAGAYSGEDGVTSLLASAARVEAPRLELVCSLHPAPQMGLAGSSAGLGVRSCLAALGAGTLMALAAAGFEQVTLRCDACGDCPWGSLQAVIQAQAAEASSLLAHWQKENVPVVCTALAAPIQRPHWKAESRPVSRRDFFRSAVQPVKDAIENASAPQPRQPGRDRLRKLQAALALGEPLNPAALLAQTEFAQLSARETCTACGACARACPTDAIHLAMDAGKQRFNLVFYARNCIHCDACVRACAPGALFIEGQPRFQEVFRTQKPVSLRSGDLVRCERCSTLIAARPDTHLCPLCEFRRTHPFGAKLPPGLQPPITGKKKLPS